MLKSDINRNEIKRTYSVSIYTTDATWDAKFPNFYGIQMSKQCLQVHITSPCPEHTRAVNIFLSHFFKSYFTVFFNVRPGLPRDPFPWAIPNKIPYMFLISICPFHPPWLGHSNSSCRMRIMGLLIVKIFSASCYFFSLSSPKHSSEHRVLNPPLFVPFLNMRKPRELHCDLTAVLVKTYVLCDITPYSALKDNLRFWGTYSLNLQG